MNQARRSYASIAAATMFLTAAFLLVDRSPSPQELQRSVASPQLPAATNFGGGIASLQLQPAVAALWGRLKALSVTRTAASAAESALFAALGKPAAQSEQRRRFGSVNEAQILHYIEFAASLAPNSTICEVGFYHGLSTLVFLQSAPTSTIYNSFDIFYIPAARAALAARFGPRLRFHEGDSRETIPRALTGGVAPCNLVHVDGNHAEEPALQDLRNMRAGAACGDNVVLSDDTHDCADFDSPGATYCDEECGGSCNCFERGFCNGASRAYWRAVREGLVEHAICFPTGFDGIYPKGFCAGRFIC